MQAQLHLAREQEKELFLVSGVPNVDFHFHSHVELLAVHKGEVEAAVNDHQAILHAGGIPIWAHPLGGEGEKPLSAEKFQAQLHCLMGLGIQGMECHYSRYETAQREFLMAQARANGLLISGGSDYHGTNKRGLSLGMLSADGAHVCTDSLTVLSAF